MRRTALAWLALAAACYDPRLRGGGDGGGGDGGGSDAPCVARPILAVAAGGRHTCFLEEGGAVLCMGHNDYGQLGVGDFEDRAAPTPVSLPDRAIAIDAGQEVSCAVLAGGALACWGRNDEGQVDPILVHQPGPVVRDDLTGVDEVAVGVTHVCARRGGEVLCWGENDNGQAGSAAPSPVVVPTSVPIGASALMIAAGEEHSCAIAAGDTYCWGKNENGQLGIGSDFGDFASPQPLGQVFERIAASADHTCGLAGGAVWCWGENQEGQVTGTPAPRILDRPTLQDDDLVAGATWLDLGEDVSCAVAGQEARCWGGDRFGQSGDGEVADFDGPGAIATGGPVIAVSAGGRHACALGAGGANVTCWGDDSQGQQGGTPTRRPLPVPWPFAANAMGGGGHHMCGYEVGVGILCGGLNVLGQAVPGATPRVAPPMAVGPAVGVGAAVVLAGGEDHTCAAVGGELWCWGDDADHQLGGAGPGPLQPEGLAGRTIIDVAAGERHTCAVELAPVQGQVWCWGRSDDGQAGASALHVVTPTLVSAIANGYRLAAGEAHTCAIDEFGDLSCWGDNDQGQLGFAGDDVATPMATGLMMVRAVAAGQDHTCALIGTEVWCWGSNEFGQLGISGIAATPLPMSAFAGIAAMDVVAGRQFTCVRSTTGRVHCAGRNDFGQLGSIVPSGWSDTPLVADLPESPWVLAAGSHHVCVWNGADARCWGSNASAQLGTVLAPSVAPRTVLASCD